MKKRKNNNIYFFIIVFLIFLIGNFYKYASKEKKVVWYISDPEVYGVKKEDVMPYQEINVERFRLFNKRLKELKIPAKVIFKYVPNRYEAKQEDFEKGNLFQKEFLFQTTMIDDLIKKDADADIVGFSPLEYEKFLKLDSYLEKQENKKVLKTIPSTAWKANEINKGTYQIPKGNVSISELTYLFYKPFLQEYHINLEEEKIKDMTPEEVIQFLKPYFKKERLLENKYYLTSAFDLRYGTYIQKRYQPVIGNSRDYNLAVDVQKKKIVSLLDTVEMQKMLELNQMIYTENLDAHIERQTKAGIPVFSMTNIPTIKELSAKEDSDWLEISAGERKVSSSFGNGVLRSSDEKELAVRILAASMYDAELTNLMIHGVPNEDYQQVDGYVVYQNTGIALSSMGSFSNIGNNRIAYPNELEVKEKSDITEQIMKKTAVSQYGNFTPALDHEQWKHMAEIVAIYDTMEGRTESEKISDFQMFLKEYQEKLKQAGVEEIILEFQNQLDHWEE